MQSNRKEAEQRGGRSRLAGAWLALPVYADALRLAPRAWLTALWWRVLGKRVRSRARFAPLLSASSRAYRLWLLNEQAPAIAKAGQDTPPLFVIVAAGQGQGDTLASLAGQGAEVLALGTAEVPTLADAAARIDWIREPWIMPLAAGDMLAPGAVEVYRTAGSETGARIVYADDDILDGRGRRCAAHFKPSWNPELLRHFDYLTGACILRTHPADLAALSDADWARRLVATVAAGTPAAGVDGAPVRLPHVLHHRRSRPMPRVPASFGAGEGAPGARLPKVSIIVPTRNRSDLLRTCIDGLGRTDYPDMEVIVVDNGSDDPATLAYLAGLDGAEHPVRHRVLRCPGPFNFSTLNNRAAALAQGELLCLLNNDIEILAPDWLEILARQALRPEVGAVGARLLYPDGRIQHAGVVLGICGGAAHAHRLLAPGEEGYFRRHALPQFVSAVTAACLVVRKDSFAAVGGLDEARFAVAFNDVDLCMRLNAKGWQSFYEPRATLVHHESVSRGFDRDPVGAARMAGELAALKERWGTGDMEGEGDPYHHPQLSRFSERFAVRI
jgi:GT2 family glycosyltransferase